METFPRYWPFVWGIHRSPVNSLQKGQWRRALLFPLIYAWINDLINNREVGDLTSSGSLWRHANRCPPNASVWWWSTNIRSGCSSVSLQNVYQCRSLTGNQFWEFRITITIIRERDTTRAQSWQNRGCVSALINTLRQRQHGCHFADDIFWCIFVNEKFGILIKISLKFVPKSLSYNNPALV